MTPASFSERLSAEPPAPGRPFARTVLWLWAGMVLAIVLTHAADFFVTPWFEHDDAAVNALQIIRAKQLEEIHGNYSRFQFHHPGPAFFYVYAAAEAVLHDALHAVPAPYNAHALAGVALQSLFLALALAITASWVRHPLLVPALLVAAAVHFALTRSAFISIWPPHVLLMPFVCLLAAGASVAAGRTAHLPWLVLAGGFLVHGHVAQPLFVGAIAGAAGVALWLHPGRERAGARVYAVALALLLVFLAPLAVDATAGSDSNLARILAFARHHAEDGKSLWKSLLYLIGFLSYLPNANDYLPVHGPADAGFVAQKPAYYIPWAIAAFFALRYLLQVARDRSATERRFVLWLGTFVAAASGLCLYWGTRQVGEMFTFNGFFYYALPYAGFLLVAAGGCRAWPTRGHPGLGRSGFAGPIAAPVVAVAAAAVYAVLSTGQSVAPGNANAVEPRQVVAALAEDPARGGPKLLVFAHPDWGDAAAVALALARQGGDFRVSEDWQFMFGPDRALSLRAQDPVPDGLSAWWISRPTPTAAVRIGFAPPAIDPKGTRLAAAQIAGSHIVFGLHPAGPEGTWTNRSDVGLAFRSAPVERDVVLSITARPFAAPGSPADQPAELFVNGAPLGIRALRDRGTVEWRIPAPIWNRSTPLALGLHFPRAIPPRSVGVPDDSPGLGWQIAEFGFRLAD